MVDTPPQKISWTREEVDQYLESIGLDLPDWQREWLIRVGDLPVRQLTLHPRKTGKRAAYEHTRNLAIALGYKVTDVPHGFTIELSQEES